jgi:hypothetical protein
MPHASDCLEGRQTWSTPLTHNSWNVACAATRVASAAKRVAANSIASSAKDWQTNATLQHPAALEAVKYAGARAADYPPYRGVP